jgi:DNA-binding transcriptional MerR regulator
MKIGAFMEQMATTQDTVRHYEELGLLTPVRENTRRIYSEKEVADFAAIKEMQQLGMSLREIQVIFEVKRSSGCASGALLQEVRQTLGEKQKEFICQEAEIKEKRAKLEALLAVLERK